MDKPDIFKIAAKIARGLGDGTILPNSTYGGVYSNLEDYIMQVLEENYGIAARAERHKYRAKLNVQLEPIIMFWIENESYLLSCPVPHPELSNEQANYNVENKWTDDKYGDAHRRLCLHIANELERSTPIKRWFKWITA